MYVHVWSYCPRQQLTRSWSYNSSFLTIFNKLVQLPSFNLKFNQSIRAYVHMQGALNERWRWRWSANFFSYMLHACMHTVTDIFVAHIMNGVSIVMVKCSPNKVNRSKWIFQKKLPDQTFYVTLAINLLELFYNFKLSYTVYSPHF